MKLACEGCEGSEGAAGGDSMGAESLQAAMCYVTVSQDVYSFGKESIASGRHFLGSCQPRSRCGVIGGGARGLGGVQTGGMAGLVTSRFRVWTDLIEPATSFTQKCSPAVIVARRVNYRLRGVGRIRGSSEAPLGASWFVSSPL
jgi:hypothetical protein